MNKKGTKKRTKKVSKNVIIILVVSLIVFLIAVLLMNYTNKKQTKMQKEEFLQAAEEYYNSNMASIYGLDEAEITLNALFNANKKEEVYKISSLKKCDKEATKITYIIESGKVKDKKYQIVCK